MKSLAFLAFFLSSAVAQAECREESLVRFYSNGVEQESRLVGASDPCDDFGGNLIHTPVENIYLYVNFNIAGSINLDLLDKVLSTSPVDKETRAWLQSVKLAVVDRHWIKRVYQTPSEAVLNMAGDTLFVSEMVLLRGEFEQLVASFYRGE
jgi:hypothetical protein